ncbi:hypothetical protein Sjap_017755 [Stephania japonica]|uniref:CLAVATA3/ESR (CLE)-related protein 9 n=1 Tax=Stephania japonica TaxID=461633 RepID=A0AAP0I6U1_9MAGN
MIDMMKSSSSSRATTSCSCRITMFALLVLLLYLSVTTTSKTQLAEALSSKDIMSSDSMQTHRYKQSQTGSSSQIHLNRPPLCSQLQRKHNYYLRHPPPLSLPPSSPPLDEIDPRYGVEKRLVPTGPNPLHN